MTPKEKAKELIEMFIFFASDEETTEDGFMYSEAMRIFNAKQCALIAVDEVINQCRVMDGGFSFEKEMEFWQRVKREIENL